LIEGTVYFTGVGEGLTTAAKRHIGTAYCPSRESRVTERTREAARATLKPRIGKELPASGEMLLRSNRIPAIETGLQLKPMCDGQGGRASLILCQIESSICEFGCGTIVTRTHGGVTGPGYREKVAPEISSRLRELARASCSFNSLLRRISLGD
jgi:hypothetical protein